MEPIKLPTLGYFKNGNGWLGSAGLMRFQIEKPDENGQVTVVLWQGPFSRPYAQETGRETFPLDEPGLTALQNFLAAKAQEMAQNPPFTPEETSAFYQAKKAEEAAPKEE